MSETPPQEWPRETTVGEIGEVALIRRLAAILGTPTGVTVGIGDDTAVVPGAPGEEWLLTSDAVLEGIHFLPEAEPEQIGHKAVARNLSDIAAMGGEPHFGLVNLVAPRDTPVSRLERIYRGAEAVSRRHGLSLIGGDTACGAALALHVFVTGTVPAGKACLRSGARPGDRVFVTGTLGGSLAGRHLTFEPRVREGIWIRTGGWAGAMIDVSDGLATDLRHVLAASSVGVCLDQDRIPLSEAARSIGRGASPLDHALRDGEDFELLFTVRADRAAAFTAAWGKAFALRCTEIGEIREGANEFLLRARDGSVKVLRTDGFQHFRV